MTYWYVVADVLKKHGSPALHLLDLSDYQTEIPVEVMAQVQGFFGLRTLSLQTEGFGLDDYGKLCQFMPLGLTSLYMDINVSDTDGHNTLDVFNRLQQLVSLTLSCHWIQYDEGDAGCILGDLDLPCLQKLEVLRSFSCERVVARDLSFAKIPVTCSVVCEIELEVESAKSRSNVQSSVSHTS